MNNQRKNVYIYSDQGAGGFSLMATQRHFAENNVFFIQAKDIIADGIPQNADLFIMPGGADRPYTEKLNGLGNHNIHTYVEQGGTYLGICAGAYYGCEKIAFQKDTPDAICENRELAFFKGTAIGCLPQISDCYYDETLKSAAVIEIKTKTKTYTVFYWGGCYFEKDVQDEKTDILARYAFLEGNPPVIIRRQIGQGHAILSGVHFEVTPEALLDYPFESKIDSDNKQNAARTLAAGEALDFQALCNLQESKAI